MNKTVLQKAFSFHGPQFKWKSSQALEKKGYLGTSENCLPASREKKSGTSVTPHPSLNHSLSLIPPPIRPMVEKYPLARQETTENKIQKRIEECA